MTGNVLTGEIIKNLSLLKQKEQNEVLSYIKSLLSKNNGKAGLLKLFGSIDTKDADEMMKAINKGCENIDYNEW